MKVSGDIILIVVLAVFAFCQADNVNAKIRKLVLLGDSLMANPYNDFALADKIQAKLVNNETLLILNGGIGGNTIEEILRRTRLTLGLYDVQPHDFVLLFWDSDCSDIDEYSMTPEQKTELRAAYMLHVQQTIEIIREFTMYVSIAGPELLGEGPQSDPSFSCGHWEHKTEMLEDYRNMTHTVANTAGVRYMDMRGAFLSKLPSNWMSCSGALTVDGEHPNDAGADLEASIFAEVLNEWLAPSVSTRASSTKFDEEN